MATTTTTTTSSGQFILDVAKIGQSLMTSFTKFMTYRKVLDPRLENLYATLSITTSTLLELGQTLIKYESDFHIKEQAFKPVCEIAKGNLERLLLLINEGISSGVWKNDGNLGGQAFTAEADPWLLITVSLGGRDHAEHFWGSLDDTRNSLLELKDIVQYMILKKLSQRTTLTPEQSLEFKNITALLPHIVHSVEKAEHIKKEWAEYERERLQRMNRAPMPDFNQRDVDEVSDITLFENKESRGRRAHVGKDNYKRNSSLESSRSDHSSVIERREPPCEIYEQWTLRWNQPPRYADSVTKCLGIKKTKYFADPGFWRTDPEFRTQEEMKEYHRLDIGDLSPAKHQDMIKKVVRAIPKHGGLALDHLLEDRIDVSNHEGAKAAWQIVCIKPVEKHLYSSSKKWGKDPKTTDWLITLRGERIDTVVREMPIRHADPWNKDSRMRGARDRYRSPSGRVYVRERSSSPRGRVRREPVVIRPGPRAMSPPRRVATIDAVPDPGFRVGNLVIGRIPTQEEAERRIEEIWAAMTSSVEDDVSD